MIAAWQMVIAYTPGTLVMLNPGKYMSICTISIGISPSILQIP
jgi:hypothetical protein